ncbi:alcohol dehydrogenase 1-like [Manduca sexta]|uniref:Alcohol dehydrogenase n=1 Tax=Manduca sexta TaxID=7130 RepID=A0A921ZPQ3_MANSE|nr:alcohol dehydrogenase 1-like [Manduca sexta]KAG6461818.1 hypothetical protein O3G_MSEX012874 [Manduca sexta]
MSKYIENKICVITGGADGIGLSIADKYLENNAKVVILVDFNEQKGKEAAKILNTKHGDGKAEFIKCDVRKDLEATYNVIMDNYQYVDVLVNNAGIGDAIPRRTMETNAIAVIEWSLKFSNHMRKDTEGKGGTIVNVASVLGYDIVPYAHIYQASKFAVTGFTRSLGHKYLYPTRGVRMVCLCPGLTKTNLSQAVLMMKPQSDYEAEVIKEFKDMVIQEVDVVGEAAVEILERADSGTVWSIINGELKNVHMEVKYKL